MLILLVSTISYAQEEIPIPDPSPIVVQGTTNFTNTPAISMADVTTQLNTIGWVNQGITGAGVKIGVLDRGFRNILSFEQRTGAITTIYTGSTKEEYDVQETNHGTLVLETIHQIAPNASLVACKYDDFIGYSFCVNWMINYEGVNIINHSAGVPAIGIGLSDWTKEVDIATERGVLWVNSAGNFGQGFVEDYFIDSRRGDVANGSNGWHEFRESIEPNAETISITPMIQSGIPKQGIVMLSWEDPDVQLSLKISYGNSAEVTTEIGQNLQYGYVDINQDFRVGVRNEGGDEAIGTRFFLYIEFVQIPISRGERSIITPANSQNALTVGALNGLREIAPYSSRGPVSDGVKPDLVTFGAVNINGEDFVGTSASAALTSGAAALVWEYFARLGMTQNLNQTIKDFLMSEANEIGNPFFYGNGSLNLPLDLPQGGLSIPTPTPEPTTQAGITLVTVNKTFNVNVRSGPGTVYPEIGVASPKESFEALNYTPINDGWFRINYRNNTNAWIAGDVVSYTAEALRLPAPSTIPDPPILTVTESVNVPVQTPTTQNPPDSPTQPLVPPTLPYITNAYLTGERLVCGVDKRLTMHLSYANPSNQQILLKFTYGDFIYEQITAQSSGTYSIDEVCTLNSPNGFCTVHYEMRLGDGNLLGSGILEWKDTETPCP